jgi:hypothetical protein
LSLDIILQIATVSALKTRWKSSKAGPGSVLLPADTHPIDLRVELNLLSEQEKQWLDEYHLKVRETLSPRVDSDARPWLFEATAPIRVTR